MRVLKGSIVLLVLALLPSLGVMADVRSHRSTQVPLPTTPREDNYFAGYIQALVDMHYHEFQIVVTARNRKIILNNLPKNELIATSIQEFVREIPGVEGVMVDPRKVENRAPVQTADAVDGIWFPQTTVLFSPLIADPRQVGYTASYRFNDDPFGQKIGAFSFGDVLPIFRWRDEWPWHGDLQIGLEAGIWAIYDLEKSSAPLINADYYIGIPLTYAFGNWSTRLRVYHVSSHLGDEFLLNNPGFDRRNVSFEAIDWVWAYQVRDQIRFYGGLGYIGSSDESYDLDPVYIVYGAEVKLLGHRDTYNKLYGQPFLAMHFRNAQDVDFKVDATYMIGCEWSKLRGVGRKVRLAVIYRDGYAQEGQFSRMKTDYISLQLSYGF